MRKGSPAPAIWGYFVNNAAFRPSTFDERVAMPVLLRELPSLSDPRIVVVVVVEHLHRPWARPDAFLPLVEVSIQDSLNSPTLSFLV